MGDKSHPNGRSNLEQSIPTTLFPLPDLEPDRRISHDKVAIRHHLGVAAIGQPNIILDQHMRQNQLELLCCKEAPRTNVPPPAEHMVVGAGLHELTGVVASLALLQEAASVELGSVRVDFRVPQVHRVDHDMGAPRDEAPVWERRVLEGDAFENNWRDEGVNLTYSKFVQELHFVTKKETYRAHYAASATPSGSYQAKPYH